MTMTMSLPIGHAVRWPTFFVVVPNYNHVRYLEAWSHLSAKTTCSRHFLYGPMLRSLKLIRYHPTLTLFLLREVVRRRHVAALLQPFQ